MGYTQQRYAPSLPHTRLRADCGGGHQSLGGRGDEGVSVRSQSKTIFEQDSPGVLDLLRDFDADIEGIDLASFAGDRPAIYLKHRRLGIAPLSIFGDAMRRSVLLAATLPRLKNGGILLIDEVETGIHVRALGRVFDWLVAAARRLGVQVFVTTHSLEALDALISAPSASPADDVVAFHLTQSEAGTACKRFGGDLLHRLRFERGLDVRWIMRYGYLAVEGPHDQELVYRLLSPFGLKRVRLLTDLDAALHVLVPRNYPPGGDLLKRMPVPLFMQSATHAIAVHSAVGDTRLVELVEENARVLALITVEGIGILLDSDKAIPAAQRYTDICNSMAKKNFVLDPQAGVITAGPPRLGAFVLPDNVGAGTLEDLLLDVAPQVYPGLLNTARSHVAAALQDPGLIKEDLDELRKPAGENKAVIGAMAALLRPGKAVQVSLQDNRWLKGAALASPRVKAVQNFLKELFDCGDEDIQGAAGAPEPLGSERAGHSMNDPTGSGRRWIP